MRIHTNPKRPNKGEMMQSYLNGCIYYINEKPFNISKYYFLRPLNPAKSLLETILKTSKHMPNYSEFRHESNIRNRARNMSCKSYRNQKMQGLVHNYLIYKGLNATVLTPTVIGETQCTQCSFSSSLTASRWHHGPSIQIQPHCLPPGCYLRSMSLSMPLPFFLGNSDQLRPSQATIQPSLHSSTRDLYINVFNFANRRVNQKPSNQPMVCCKPTYGLLLLTFDRDFWSI